MKEIKVSVNTWYVVEGTAGATVINPSTNKAIATVEEGKQTAFFATTPYVLVSDDSVNIFKLPFNHAPAFGSGSGGGATIQFDTTPTQNSTNAVTSDGLYKLLLGTGVTLGGGAKTTGSYGVAIGNSSSAHAFSFAAGKDAKAGGNDSVAIGCAVSAHRAIGINAPLKDNSTCVFGIDAWDAPNLSTRFYIVGAGSPLANKYFGDENGQNGAAFLGYVVKESNGNVLECGAKKLSDLLNEKTAWAPAALDLDADPPMPFLPTGIFDPVELPEDLTE